jgi:hypothetical protein
MQRQLFMLGHELSNSSTVVQCVCLINTRSLELVDANTLQWPTYAILLHRWGAEEITLQHLALRTSSGQRPLKSVVWKATRKFYGSVPRLRTRVSTMVGLIPVSLTRQVVLSGPRR